MKKVLIALVFLFSLTAFAAEDNQKDSFDGIELVKDFDQVNIQEIGSAKVLKIESENQANESLLQYEFKRTGKKDENSISRLYKNKRSPVLNELAFKTVKDKPKLT